MQKGWGRQQEREECEERSEKIVREGNEREGAEKEEEQIRKVRDEGVGETNRCGKQY